MWKRVLAREVRIFNYSLIEHGTRVEVELTGGSTCGTELSFSISVIHKDNPEANLINIPISIAFSDFEEDRGLTEEKVIYVVADIVDKGMAYDRKRLK